MGDLLIGDVYPPSLGRINKMMVGDVQVWPRPDPLIIENWPPLLSVLGFTPYVFGKLANDPQTPTAEGVYVGSNDGLGGSNYSPHNAPSTWHTGLKLPPGLYELGEAHSGGYPVVWNNPVGQDFLSNALIVTAPAGSYDTTVYVREAASQAIRKIMIFGTGIDVPPSVQLPVGPITPTVGSFRFMADGSIMGGTEGQASHTQRIGSWGGNGYSVRINKVDGAMYNSGTSPLNKWFSVLNPSGSNQPYVCRMAAEGGGNVRWCKFKVEVRNDSTSVITTYFVTLSTRPPPESSVSSA
jgi:hypothetical protein